MTRRWILVVLVAAVAIGALVAEAVDSHSPNAVLILLGLGVVFGELVELRPSGRARIPTSHAVVLVLLRAATTAQLLVVVAGAQVVAAFVREEPVTVPARARVLAQRGVATIAAVLAYRAVSDAFAGSNGRWAALLALGGAAVAQLAVDEVASVARQRRVTLAWRERGAELALVSSGMLMAVGYRGINGKGGMGLWGPVLFSVPLLAAVYSFEQLRNTRRTYDQTIRALSVVPELGELVPSGHAERVTDLALAMARELGLGRTETEQLEVAALLHHIGQVTLEDPEVLGRVPEPAVVAVASAQLLRATQYLSPSGDLVAAVSLPHRGSDGLSARTALGAQILKVANDFDGLARGDRRRMTYAVETLYAGPGSVYDGRVLAALEAVLPRRGLLSWAQGS